jgi:hypothetical protein
MDTAAGDCPFCGAPYRKTLSADEDTLGELAVPAEEYAAMCYNVRARSDVYLGFTLYLHPATVYAVETRTEDAEGKEPGTDGWSQEDVYASEANARSRRDRLGGGSVEARIRELPLAHARLPPEERPQEPRL